MRIGSENRRSTSNGVLDILASLSAKDRVGTLARCALVENINEFRQLSQAFQNFPLIIAAPGECVAAAPAALLKGHHVFVSMDGSALGVRDVFHLSRPQGHLVEQLLKGAGLSGADAQRVSRDFGRSIPVLRRQLSVSKAVRTPAWANAESARVLIPVLLGGAWNENEAGDRRDRLGTTHHDAGSLWMGANPATSVTNDFGRIHDTTNCYVASPALFPTVGSPNPMLTGTALVRRTADLLAASVLPAPALRAPSAGFKALFDGTIATFRKWKPAGRANVLQGFQFLDGELVSYGSTSDIALLYYAAEAFADFHLRLQFKIFDPNNHNSGVFVRFRDPLAAMPEEIRNRAAAAGDSIASNPALSAIHSGFEIQIDDNARGDTRRDFHGRFPEPDGLFKNRTGAIYKIPAGDSIMHLGAVDERAQEYVPGPALLPNVWFQYDIVVTGNRYEVTLTDTESGQSQRTTVFNNPDAARGVAAIEGAPAGFVGIQSYPNSRVVFRDIWIK